MRLAFFMSGCNIHFGRRGYNRSDWGSTQPIALGNGILIQPPLSSQTFG
jgi:hypothetical protein